MFTSFEIDHVAHLVSDLDKAIQLHVALSGMRETFREEVEDGQAVAVVLARPEEPSAPTIELLCPFGEQGVLAKRLKKAGEGFHHICYKVEGIENHLLRLKNSGVQLIDETPRAGICGSKIAFIHPKSTMGLLVELAERA